MDSKRRDVHRRLRARGFELKGTLKSAAAYEGPLNFRGGRVPVRVDIVDWDFITPPEIRLLERPDALKGYRPHLGRGSLVCYLDRESVYMDPFDPAGVIERCLDEAAATIEDIAGGKHRLDLHDEFLAHWREAAAVPLMLWGESGSAKRMLACLPVDFKHYSGTFVVTDDAAKTTQILRNTGAAVSTAEKDAVVEFTTEKAPAIDPDTWPPKRLAEILTWLHAWDPALEYAFRGKLESRWAIQRNHFIALFRTPSGHFGLDFHVGYADAREQKYYAKRPPERRQYILVKKNPTVSRFEVSDLSPRYLHARNMPARATLFGKRIALIGAGTIGGYLGTYLARLGAGYEGGALRVYDSQALGPENIGRHVLSLRQLYQNKAQALADFIGGEFPYLRILAHPIDARKSSELLEADVVIDATGSTAFSSWLNRQHIALLQNEAKAPPIIYAWVEGPGDAARSLLVDSLKYMCFDCLLLRHPDRSPDDRFPISTRDPAEGRERPGGCSTYMPFAVSASATAAALAADTVRDWARGDPHPRLRAKRLDIQRTLGREDASPKPLTTCPACGRS
jgi:hypothetical protein